MATTCILVRTSVSSEQQAKTLARSALDARLAACVQILGSGQSLYRWHGAVEQASEYYLEFKTSTGKCHALLDWLSLEHPYDVPEIMWQEWETSTAYGKWLHQETE